MAKTYFVIARETCPRCGGDGMIDVLHPVTQDIEKVECPDCRGEGVVKGEVPLEEAIKELATAEFLMDIETII